MVNERRTCQTGVHLGDSDFCIERRPLFHGRICDGRVRCRAKSSRMEHPPPTERYWGLVRVLCNFHQALSWFESGFPKGTTSQIANSVNGKGALRRESDRQGGESMENRRQITDDTMKSRRFLSLSCPRQKFSRTNYSMIWTCFGS